MSVVKHTVKYLPKNRLLVEGVCPVTKTSWAVILTEEEYSNWKAGVLNEVSFPSLTPTEHLLLMTGIIPSEVRDFSGLD